MSAGSDLLVVANTRLPSRRAQALQVVQAAAAFARAGRPTRILYARRHGDAPGARAAQVAEYYGVAPGPCPELEPIACLDWIERVPRSWQYVPARLQEASFARNAAHAVQARGRDALVISREIECARELVQRAHPGVVLEIHRVPGGRLRRRWLLQAARGARGLIAISGGVKADLVGLGISRESIRVEHDALEPARFARLPERNEARAALGLDPAASIVVYTGGLLAWKGVDVLVDAARRLPGVRFVIAGGMDADVERLRSVAAGATNVRIDGFQPPSRIPLYLSAADVGVVPNRSAPAISARYTSPLKVFEAFACGLPLVASDLPALRELLEHEREAVLVAADEPRALADGIERLLADDALRAAISQRLRARAAGCTWDARARRILSAFGAHEARSEA